MSPVSCLWQQSRLERYVDGALGGRAARGVLAHVDRCGMCRARLESIDRMRHLVRSTMARPADPDWSAFWVGVERRIRSETPRPVGGPWWRPLWKPVWGHPRLASAAAALAVALLTVPLWTTTDDVGLGTDAPVTVQDATTDSRGGLMVYSNPNPAMTVVWVLPPDGAGSDD